MASSVPPLEAPYPGASIKVAAQRYFKKYATFSGRASRSEYWWWALIAFLVTAILEIIIFSNRSTTTTLSSTGTSANALVMATSPGAVLAGILLLTWGAGTIIPSLALLARRLHDANLSAWLILLLLVPGLGGLACSSWRCFRRTLRAGALTRDEQHPHIQRPDTDRTRA